MILKTICGTSAHTQQSARKEEEEQKSLLARFLSPSDVSPTPIVLRHATETVCRNGGRNYDVINPIRSASLPPHRLLAGDES